MTKKVEKAVLCAKNRAHSACKNYTDMDAWGKKEKGAPRTNLEQNGNGRDEEYSGDIGWKRATKLAQDRAVWRDLVDALCATRHYGIERWLRLLLNSRQISAYLACEQALDCVIRGGKKQARRDSWEWSGERKIPPHQARFARHMLFFIAIVESLFRG